MTGSNIDALNNKSACEHSNDGLAPKAAEGSTGVLIGMKSDALFVLDRNDDVENSRGQGTWEVINPGGHHPDPGHARPPGRRPIICRPGSSSPGVAQVPGLHFRRGLPD